MKKIVFVFLIFFNATNIFASFSGGYKFYFNGNRNMCISIRFHFGIIPEYLSKSDRLFFDILNWIIHNKNTLENVVNDHLEIWIGPERNVNIIGGSLDIIGLEGMDMDKIRNINQKIYEYKNYNELRQNIIKIIESYYNFTSTPIVNDHFGLYFVWTKEPYRPYKQQENTEIFIGPFPGQMFNYPGLKRGVVFWELETANTYLYENGDDDIDYLEYIVLNKNNIMEIFGYLD
jgi:hypothetical protein